VNPGRQWRALGMLGAANASALGLQFLTTILVAREFGASAQMDAYMLAITFPEALQYLLMLASLSVIFTPLFIEARAQHGVTEAWSMALSLLVLVVLFVLAVIPVLVALMPALMSLLGPGLAPPTRALAVELSDLILPSLFYYATAGILLGICYAYHDFTTAALNTLLLALSNLLVFFVFVALLAWGVYGLVVGRLVALAAMELWLLWRVWRHKRNVRAKAQLRNPRVWHMLTYLPPYMAGAMAGQVELIITRSLVSTLGAGSIAAWGYGQRIADIPMTVLGAAFGATYLPAFATSVVQDDRAAASAQWNRAAERVTFMLMPIAMLLITLGAPLIALLFQRGAFDAVATHNTALVLMGLSFALPLRGIGGLIVRGMPAFKARWLPLLLSMLSTGGTLVFALALLAPLGLSGVALAASIGDLLFVAVGTGVFWRWLATRTWLRELFEFSKMIVAAVVGGASSFAIAHLDWTAAVGNEFAARLLQVGVAASFGLLTFLAVTLALRVQASHALWGMVADRASRIVKRETSNVKRQT